MSDVTAYCTVYRQMLTNPSWIDAGKSDLMLQEAEECHHVFADFLRFETSKLFSFMCEVL